MATEIAPTAPLRASLDALAESVAAARFDLPSPEQEDRRRLKEDTLWSIRNYLIPRLGDLEAPVVAVIIGSTGSGKSTILNTLAQHRVSEPGAVRPTTRRPVVWAHRRHADRYRRFGEGPEPVVVAQDDHLLEGLTVVDAPDFDSVVAEHRLVADHLLSMADLCVFVTSAQRYADAVPWEFLHRARTRRVPIVFVVNRVPVAGSDELVADYARLLHEGGVLDEAELEAPITIAEQPIDPVHGGLPPATVESLRSLLEGLADPVSRRRVVEQAVRGALDEVSLRADLLVAQIYAEQEEGADLVDATSSAYAVQVDELHRSLQEGSLIRGEVLRRWQELVGSGELLTALSEGVGKVRGWLRAVVGGKPSAEQIERETREELAGSIVRRADLAARATATAWELDPAGKVLLSESHGALWRHGTDTPDLADRALDDWLAHVASLVEREGAGRRKMAVAASYGVNAVAVGLLLGVFVQTGGLTGAEVGITAGAAAAQQKVLEHMFGTAAARSLAEQARLTLDEALERVMDADAARYQREVERRVADPALANRIDGALAGARRRGEELYGR